ncbi:MAG: DNA gyrase inhibitor YacG [Betaproteobacteria bacterium]|nr:MAG: DNA gyrase inhibitor YacG [Betaproteobacteria bacterium]
MQSVKKVPCPRCGAPALFGPENKWRPFCSERCKMIDLGLWASESYRVPDKESGPQDNAGSDPESSSSPSSR